MHRQIYEPAGLTAAKMKPRDSANANGILNIQTDDKAQVNASIRPGKSVSRSDALPALATALIFISTDEIKRMVHKPMVRIVSPKPGGRSKALPSPFFMRMPEISDPSRGGDPTVWER